ncbi:hypothetical protein JXQ70_13435 [bacterium]|nr:hypothetical protein [bacterium]
MTVKTVVIGMIAIGLLFQSTILTAETVDRTILKAMEAELSRTMDQLKMEGFEAPYYVSYKINEADYVLMKAVFGALTEDTRDRQRYLLIDMRVGDYQLDNSHFIGQDFGGRRGMYSPVTIENDYDAIRHGIWLATDRAYKSALETLARKKATIENRLIEDRPDDFSRVEPTVLLEQAVELDLDRTRLAETIRDLSGLFREFPLLQSSKVMLTATASNHYFVDSEGSQHLKGKTTISLYAYASTQAQDGHELDDFREFHFRTAAEFLTALGPIEISLKEMGSLLTSLTTVAETKSYIGPVLFTDQAAAQLLYQIIGKGVSNAVTPLYENEMFSRYMQNESDGFLANRIGLQIMPEKFSVYDDPNLDDWQGNHLIGGFKVDDQGVKAQKVQLVEAGKLETVLMSRAPIKKVTRSNGHARGGSFSQPVARVGNLIVQAESGLSDQALKDTFINLLKDLGLESGVIVTRLKTQVPPDLFDDRSAMISFFGGRSTKLKLLTEPLEAYLLDLKTGTMNVLSPMEFTDVNYRVLKDIVAHSTDLNVHNFISNERMEGMLPMSVVAPDLIIEEMELSARETKPTRQPYLPHPFFEQKK